MASLAIGPAGPLHLSRNLLSGYAQLAAAPTGNGAELFAVVAFIYRRVPAGLRLAPAPPGRCVMRRRHLTRDQKFIVSAVAVGLLLAAGHGQGGPGHATAAASAGSGSSNEQLANSMAAVWLRLDRQPDAPAWTSCGPRRAGSTRPALNASSGATGIPQLLPGAHAIPANWSDPRVQIRWGLAYIHDTYGSPCAAWAFEKSHVPNWY